MDPEQPRQPEPAPLPGRKALVVEPRLALEADAAEQFAQPGRGRRLAVECELPAQVVRRAEVVLAAGQVALVGDRGMPCVARGRGGGAAPTNRACDRPAQPRERAQQGRLAAAIGPAQANPLARPKAEADAVEQGAHAGGAGQALDFEPIGVDDIVAIHGTTWSTRTTSSVAPVAPGATGLLTPKTSPAAGVALPLALMRISTTTSSASDNWRCAGIDCASPCAKLPSNSASGRRIAAKGMREPDGARALTNTVAVGGRPASRAASISTRPATRAGPAADAVAPAPSVSLAAFGPSPISARTSRIWGACGLAGARCARRASGCLRAPRPSGHSPGDRPGRSPAPGRAARSGVRRSDHPV